MAASGGDPPAQPPCMYYRRQKKVSEPQSRAFTPRVATYSSGLSLPATNRVRGWEYGSVSQDWESIYAHKVQLMNFLSTLPHRTESSVEGGKVRDTNTISCSMGRAEQSTPIIVLDSDDEDGGTAGYEKLVPQKTKQLTAAGLDDTSTTWMTSKGHQVNGTFHVEGDQNTQIVPYIQSAALINQSPLQAWRPSIQFEKVILQQRPEEDRIQDLVAATYAEKRAETQVFPALPKERKRRNLDPTSQVDGDAVAVTRKRKRRTEANPAQVDVPSEDVPSEAFIPVEEEEKPEKESDGLEDLWNDFSLAVESTKLDTLEEAGDEKEGDEKDMDSDCIHDIRLHEDLGHVCRICGMIVRRAETIIDYQWKKASRTRSGFCESRSRDADEVDIGDIKISEDFIASDIAIHPRHANQMRSHQLEGFNFLVKNLVADKPGGCILAHAPGSGKTFMLISFIQSFLARYPSARPLVVLPKGILSTWKKEIQLWQVEDIPLYDFYSVKADKRADQLEVLKSWQAKMSILFLGYKQFSQIICGDVGGNVAAACRDMLLMVPSLLILDEGHTPRNRDTDVLESLSRVQTPRKVVLSGTLFQNHVGEVFNILNLVRPKFLKMESSRPIYRRIMSQVAISGSRGLKGVCESAFTESVEDTLLHDDNFTRKAHVIRGLRELTKDVLHYYRGDILDELPGLVDFSVFLKLTPKQKDVVHKVEAYEKFKRSAVATATYIHPSLSEISEVDAVDRVNNLTDASIDSLVQSINVKDGVKARFFLNILSLADSAGEKLLAFSQYILPLKFLERLLVKMRGWHVGKEIFVISGDTSAEDRELSMDRFNNSSDAKVLFGSIKACGEGISLVGASRVIILDVHLNPSVTRQAIGRAFRPGQQKKVFVYRLVAADSAEEKFHETAFKKEIIPKLWFEWSGHCSTEDFKLNQVDVDDSEDALLESNAIRQDIKALYRR